MLFLMINEEGRRGVRLAKFGVRIWRKYGSVIGKKMWVMDGGEGC